MMRLVSRSRAGLFIALAAYVAMALSATLAWAGPGYQLDSSDPSIELTAEVPVGVAVDQSNQTIYVAEASRSLINIQPGLVDQLSPTGTPTASSPFGTGGQDFFVSVAVNPVTHGIYAYQIEGDTPQGRKGESKVSVFSSSGVLGTSFLLPQSRAQGLAADSSGRLFFPSNNTSSVQIFDSAGTQVGSVTCGSPCGGALITPQSVAFDSAGKLYVVDSANGGRVLKFAPVGGTSYVYESTLQSGEGAVAVAVDPSNDDVFVGVLTGGTQHIIAYNSSGTEFDDFGAGLATKTLIPEISGQLAVNATTHDVYLSTPGGSHLYVFERIASIPAPTVTIAAPSAVGQVEATLRATVNPKGHVLTTCAFEYTDHADFLANGYANATTVPCPGVVGDNESALVSAVVKGLDAATSYDYRIKIENHGGEAESGSQSFQTLPPLPPEATTTTASSVTKTGATLGGTVNPRGGTLSSCRLEYVSEAGFQGGGFSGASSKACSSTPSGTFATSVSAKVTGLAAGTAYRFRVVATNNAGTTQATPVAFTTVAETCAENPAFCPLPPPAPPAPPAVPAAPPSTSPPPATKKPLKCRRGFKKKKVRGKLKCVRLKKRARR